MSSPAGKIVVKTFNLPAHSDSYKALHDLMYPNDCVGVHSYMESRGGAYSHTLFYGAINYWVDLLSGKVVTTAGVDKAEKRWAAHFNNPNYFNRSKWDYIVSKHNGRLPLRIKAVREGTLVPTNNVLVTVENTDPKCYWLPNYVETLLLRMWYPITIATQSYELQKKLRDLHKQTMDDDVYTDPLFSVHDFSMRGITGDEQGGFGGGAHLLTFRGTDTSNAIDFIEEYYWPTTMPGFSVPATEHSIMCSYGGRDHEVEAYGAILDKFPEGIVSIVSDTYNIYNAANHILGEVYRDQILNRNGKVVVRPDSGNPILVNCGYKTYPMLRDDMSKEDLQEALIDGYKATLDGYVIINGGFNSETNDYVGYFGEKLDPLAQKGLLNILWEKFGGHVNNKGFKVLSQKIGIIQGDGMNPVTIIELYRAVMDAGFCCSNMVTGSGGGLLMKVDRDTLKFAFKASCVNRSGKWIDIQKDPITSAGKKSKLGKLKLVLDENGEYRTISSADVDKETFDSLKDELVTVFENGAVFNVSTWDEILERITF